MVEQDIQSYVEKSLNVGEFQSYLNNDQTVISTTKKLDIEKIQHRLADGLQSLFKQYIGTTRALSKAATQAFKAKTVGTKYYQLCCDRMRKLNDANRTGVCILVNRAARYSSTVFNVSEFESAALRNTNSNPRIFRQFLMMYGGHSYVTSLAYTLKCNYLDNMLRKSYVETVTTLTDAVILIDCSEEMENTWLQNETLLDIAKNIGRILIGLKKMPERVGVVPFSARAMSNLCSSSRLAFASINNKARLDEFIAQCSADGESHYITGIREAFRLFSKEEASRNFQAAIVLITGAMPVEPIGEIENYINSQLTRYRNKMHVVTIGIGGNATLSKLLKRIARSPTHRDPLHIDINYNNSTVADMQTFFTYFTQFDSEVLNVKGPHADIFSSNDRSVLSITSPVYHNGTFMGIVGMHMLCSELLSSITYYRRSRSNYIFILNQRTGSVIYHPMITEQTNTTLVDIRLLEKEAVSSGIIQNMLDGYQGNVTIFLQRIVYPMNNAVAIPANFAWQPIPEVGLSMCVVVMNRTYVSYKSVDPEASVSFVYHASTSYNQTSLCSFLGKAVLKDKTAVKFSPLAFTDSYAYIRTKETVAIINSYSDVIAGINSTEMFIELVSDGVKITDWLHVRWLGLFGTIDKREHDNDNSYRGMWRYVGLETGVFRIHPATKMNKEFAPQERYWYQSAIAHTNKLVVSSPYIDAITGKYIISFSKALLIKHDIFGVIGMDLPINFFLQFIARRYPQCEFEEENCFVIDSAGKLVLHQIMTRPAYSNVSFQNMHITVHEQAIARDLLEKEIMIRRTCREGGSTKRYHYYILPDRMSHNFLKRRGVPKYRISSIPNTNIYLIIKSVRRKYQVCLCQRNSSTCPNNTVGHCHCPCYTQPKPGSCSGDVTRAIPPCSLAVTDHSRLKDFRMRPSQTQTLPTCYTFRCRRHKTQHICNANAGCQWCELNADGVKLPTSFCGQYDTCYHGQLVHQNQIGALEESPTERSWCGYNCVVVLISLLVSLFLIALMATVLALSSQVESSGLRACDACERSNTNNRAEQKMSTCQRAAYKARLHEQILAAVRFIQSNARRASDCSLDSDGFTLQFSTPIDDELRSPENPTDAVVTKSPIDRDADSHKVSPPGEEHDK